MKTTGTHLAAAHPDVRRGFLVGAVLTAGVLLAGCGLGGGSRASAGDQRAITAAVRQAFVEDDPAAECSALSARLVGAIYETESRCRDLAAKHADEPDPTDVRVAGIAVDGARAAVRIQASGHAFEGVAGGVELVREGGAWKIDDLGADLLRATARASVRQGAATEPLLDDPSLRTCFADRLAGVPDDRLRELAYNTIGERGSEHTLGPMLIDCMSASGVGRAKPLPSPQEPVVDPASPVFSA